MLIMTNICIESIKTLEIKTSILFNLDFAENIILSFLFFFFLTIGLYFLIPTATAQFFNQRSN